MNYCLKELEEVKTNFQKNKRKKIGLSIFVVILILIQVFQYDVINLGSFAGIIAIYIIIFHIETDIKYFEKRIENIENTIYEILENKEDDDPND